MKQANRVFLIAILSVVAFFFIVLGHSLGLFSKNKPQTICENMSGQYVDNWFSNNLDGCYFLNGQTIVIIKPQQLIGGN